MGNKILELKIKGITKHYAYNHLNEYQVGDFLYLSPEIENEYDSNAVLIIDINGNKLGYVDKELSFGVGIIIHNLRHYANIKEVYRGEHSSISFILVYETNDYIYDVNAPAFENLVTAYDSLRPKKIIKYENSRNLSYTKNNTFKENRGDVHIKVTRNKPKESSSYINNSRSFNNDYNDYGTYNEPHNARYDDYDRIKKEEESRSYYDRDYGTHEDDFDVDPESFYDTAYNYDFEREQDDDDRYDDF